MFLSDNGCGGHINAESGQIQSPNFPNKYGNNEDCTWVITAPAEATIILNFETPFEVRCNCMNNMLSWTKRETQIIVFPDWKSFFLQLWLSWDQRWNQWEFWTVWQILREIHQHYSNFYPKPHLDEVRGGLNISSK